MPFKEVAKNYMLDQLTTNRITHMSLHTGFPATDANEVSGGSYARQSVDFDPASGGVASESTPPSFNVPAGTTVAAAGFYDAATAGTIQADAAVPQETFNQAGTYTINTATLDLNNDA